MEGGSGVVSWLRCLGWLCWKQNKGWWMAQCGVGSHANSMFSGLIGYVGILMNKGRRKVSADVVQDLFFKTLHNNWGECNWPVVVKVWEPVFLGTGMMEAVFNQEGMVSCDREMLKILVRTLASLSASLGYFVWQSWLCYSISPLEKLWVTEFFEIISYFFDQLWIQPKPRRSPTITSNSKQVGQPMAGVLYPSSPAAFIGLTDLSTRLTPCSCSRVRVSEAGGAKRSGADLLTSKWANKQFSSSACEPWPFIVLLPLPRGSRSTSCWPPLPSRSPFLIQLRMCCRVSSESLLAWKGFCVP